MLEARASGSGCSWVVMRMLDFVCSCRRSCLKRGRRQVLRSSWAADPAVALRVDHFLEQQVLRPEAQALAKKMATAWANFAKTGNPSQPGLTWEPFDPTRCQTMVFDNNCRMVDDPEAEVRKILLS